MNKEEFVKQFKENWMPDTVTATEQGWVLPSGEVLKSVRGLLDNIDSVVEQKPVEPVEPVILTPNEDLVPLAEQEQENIVILTPNEDLVPLAEQDVIVEEVKEVPKPKSKKVK